MNTALVTVLLLLADGPPEAKDVKAGWVAFGVFLALAAATVVLCISLVHQLRKAQAAKDAGVFDDND
jgi:hypothetical protein